MATLGLDSRILLRLLTGRPQESTAAVLDVLQTARSGGDRVVVSALVVAETSHALRAHYGLSSDRIRVAFRRAFGSGLFHEEEGSGVLDALEAGHEEQVFTDRLIHAGYMRRGAVLLTLDADLAKLPGSRLVG